MLPPLPAGPPSLPDRRINACFIVRDANGQARAYGAHSFGVHLHPDKRCRVCSRICARCCRSS